MVKTEQEILAIIRTLLALERNFLAEERTCLAELRTGLTLTVIGPSLSTFLAFIFANLAFEKALLFDLANFTFFSILTIIGIRISILSRSKLKEIRRMKKALKERQSEITKSSKAINELLGDCICLENGSG
jgi:uncharacterized membrane protein YidH (DUF202 family)